MPPRRRRVTSARTLHLLVNDREQVRPVGGNRIGEYIYLDGKARFLNYWSATLHLDYEPPKYSHYLTRGGPIAFYPAGETVRGTLESDDRKPVVGRVEAFHFRNEHGSRQWEGEVVAELRPSSALTVAIGPALMKASRVAQWVTSVEDAALPSDLAGHYVFSGFDQSEIALTARVNWIFSPRLSLKL